MVERFLRVRFRLLCTISDFACILCCRSLLFGRVSWEKQIQGKVLPVKASKRFNGPLCRILVEGARIWVSWAVRLLGDVIGPCRIAIRVGMMYIRWEDWMGISGHGEILLGIIPRVLSVSSGSGGTKCAGMCNSKRRSFENLKKGALYKRLTFV